MLFSNSYAPSERRVRRSGFTLVELLVVIAIIGILVGLTLPAVQMARESARRAECQNNLKNIGLALINFEGTHNTFPIAVTVTQAPATNPHHYTWIAQILPFLEQQPLYDDLNFGNSSAHGNYQDLNVKLGLLTCPSDPNEAELEDSHKIGVTNYAGSEGWLSHIQRNQFARDPQAQGSNSRDGRPANFGNDRLDLAGIFRPTKATKIAKITDGTSNTIMVSEVTIPGYTLGALGFIDDGHPRAALIGQYMIDPDFSSAVDKPLATNPPYLDAKGGTTFDRGYCPPGETCVDQHLIAPVYRSKDPINKHWTGASTSHNVCQAVFADGSVKGIPLTIDIKTWIQLNAMADGTVIKTSF